MARAVAVEAARALEWDLRIERGAELRAQAERLEARVERLVVEHRGREDEARLAAVGDLDAAGTPELLLERGDLLEAAGEPVDARVVEPVAAHGHPDQIALQPLEVRRLRVPVRAAFLPRVLGVPRRSPQRPAGLSDQILELTALEGRGMHFGRLPVRRDELHRVVAPSPLTIRLTRCSGTCARTGGSSVRASA